MSDKNFRVRHGLEVGDTAAVDAASGDIVTDGTVQTDDGTTGQVTIGGSSQGKIEIGQYNRATSGTPYIDFHSSATTADYDVRIAASGGSSTDGQGTLTITAADLTVSGNLTVNGTTTTVNSTTLTVDDKNIELGSVTTPTDTTADGGGITLKGSTDKTITWLDSNDSWNFNQNIVTTGTLDVQGGTITDSTGALSITSASNGDITITPNGTGDVDLVADTVQVGDANATATVTTNGTGDLVLNTNNGTNAGSITLANGLNGAVTLAPNGTGDVAFTFNNGGNLTNTRNYVMGTIRDATTDANGDAWSFATGTTGYRGISIDNSTTTTKRPGVVLRSFSSGGAAVTPRSAFISENSRGTPASPTAIQTNDFIGEFIATGRTSTGWVSDLVAAAPAGQTYYATESWTALTNTGTGWALALQPTATTLTSGGASRITVIDATPQALNTRADAYNFKSKANTNLVTVATDGQLQVFNTNATNPNNLYGYATKVSVSTTENALGNNITIKPGKLTGSTSYDKQTELSVIQNTTDGTVFASYEMKTQRFDGTNYTATASGNTLGRLLFNGNYAAGATPAINQPAATVTAVATETWSSGAAGTKLNFGITKTGTNTNLTVIDAASTATTFKSDAYNLQDSTGTSYMEIGSAKILNNRPHRSAVTTVSIARGSTYTPAAGVNNFIELTLTAGTDPTYIDVDNLTVAGEGGHQAILVYNNSGTSVGNGDLVIRNNGTAINSFQDSIANGSRVIFTVYCVGNYASCEYMTAA